MSDAPNPHIENVTPITLVAYTSRNSSSAQIIVADGPHEHRVGANTHTNTSHRGQQRPPNPCLARAMGTSQRRGYEKSLRVCVSATGYRGCRSVREQHNRFRKIGTPSKKFRDSCPLAPLHTEGATRTVAPIKTVDNVARLTRFGKAIVCVSTHHAAFVPRMSVSKTTDCSKIDTPSKKVAEIFSARTLKG
jgi:hypothetical protein